MPTDILTSLSEPLKAHAIAAFPDTDETNQDAESDKATTHRLDTFEIALRSHALTLAEAVLLADPTSLNKAMDSLLLYLKEVTVFTVQMMEDTTTHKSITDNAIFQRLPQILLYDTTSALPPTLLPQFWQIHPSSPFHSEGWSRYLTHPSLFSNAPTKVQFLRTCNSILKRISDTEFTGSIMRVLSVVYPLSERSGLNVLGSYNGRGVRVEERGEFEGKQTTGGGGMQDDDDGGGDKKDGTALGYEFYNTFWGVQRVFARPLDTILSSDGYEAFESFIKDIKTILAAFESTPVVAAEDTAQNDDSSKVHYRKYLTSSQLLPLQLKDPRLRTHFLTQLLMLIAHITPLSATFPSPPLSTAPGSNPAKLNAQIKQTQLSQLSDLEKRCCRLFASPSSEKELRAITWLLKERESMWRHWKKNKCNPSLERVEESYQLDSSMLKEVLHGKKRKAEENCSRTEMDLNSLPQVLTQMNSSLSDMDTFLEPYADACDPENEVDDEYHPARDSVYCWRGLRLMAKSQKEEGQLKRFGKLRRTDGNFEGVIRDIWKEKGQELGGTYVDVEDEDSQFRPKKRETETSAVAQDAEMEDAVSVGTPEADEAAKKEKRAEFEKAAMDMEDELFSDVEEEKGTDESKKEMEDAAGTDDVMEPTANDEPSTENKDDAADAQAENEHNGDKEIKTDVEGSKEITEETPATGSEAAKSKESENSDSKGAVDPTNDTSLPTKEEDIKPVSLPATAKQSDDDNETEAKSTKTTSKKSNGGKDTKPTVHSVKPRAKFTPPNKNQPTQRQDRSKDSSTSERRGSDSHRGQPPQQQRGGRFGNRDEKHIHMDGGRGDNRDKRGDGYKNMPPQGRGGRGWQPPSGRGRGGRDSNRGPRDERRAGRGRR